MYALYDSSFTRRRFSQLRPPLRHCTEPDQILRKLSCRSVFPSSNCHGENPRFLDGHGGSTTSSIHHDGSQHVHVQHWMLPLELVNLKTCARFMKNSSTGRNLRDFHHTHSHCVQKASTRCENFQLLPMLSPSAPVVPLVANTDANSLEVRPDVSASKILVCFRAENPC